MTLVTALELIKEIVHGHQIYAHKYGHNIPSRFLSETAGVYFEAFGVVKSHARNQAEINRALVAEALYRDFTDPTGDDETTKLFGKLQNQTEATWIK